MTLAAYIRGDVKYDGREDQEEGWSTGQRSNTRRDCRNGYGNAKARRDSREEGARRAGGKTARLESQRTAYIPPWRIKVFIVHIDEETGARSRR